MINLQQYQRPIEFGKVGEIGLDFSPVHETVKSRKGITYNIRDIKEEDRDFEGVVRVLRESFPDLGGGSYDELLHPENYRAILARGVKVIVAEEETSKDMVACSILTPDERNMSVEMSVIAVDPEHRREGLCSLLFEKSLRSAELSGVEYINAFCETFDPITQHLCKKHGFRKVGVMHGPILAGIDDNNYYRATVVLYEKLLRPEITQQDPRVLDYRWEIRRGKTRDVPGPDW